jgi:hypothetical protein
MALKPLAYSAGTEYNHAARRIDASCTSAPVAMDANRTSAGHVILKMSRACSRIGQRLEERVPPSLLVPRGVSEVAGFRIRRHR